MKKFSAFISMALVMSLLVFAFTGCGSQVQKEPGSSESSQTPQSSASSTPAKEKTVVKFWTNNRNDVEYMTEKITAFNQSNPDGIEIDYQVHTDNYIQVLDLAFSTNEGPDIIQDGYGAMVKYLGMGLLLPVDQYMTSEAKARFGEGAFLPLVNMFDGKIYSMPGILATTTRIFYNQGIFDKAGIAEAPKTLDEFVQTADTITKKLKGEGIYGFAINLKSPASALQRTLDFMATKTDGTRGGFDFAEGKYVFDGYKPLLQAFRKIFELGANFPGCENLDIDPLRAQFADGKIGMYISYVHAEPSVYKTQFPTNVDWRVADLPLQGYDEGAQLQNGATWLCMTNQSKNPEKVWKVMEYLHSDEVLVKHFESSLGMVTIPSVLEKAKMPESISKNPKLLMKDEKFWPNSPINVKPEGLDMYNVFSAHILGAKDYSDVDKVIEDLNKRYNDAYAKAIKDGTTEELKFPGFDPHNPASALK